MAPAVSGDFTLSANRVLTVAAGATASTGTVTVTGVDNSLDAPDRTVTVSATATNGLGVTGPSDVTLTLTDDDGASALSIDSPRVAEGDSGTATLTFAVTLAPASGQQVTVAWADAGTGTATPGTDYAAIAGGTLTFAPNETSKTIAVTVTGDRVDEPDETVVIELSNPANATLGTATGTGTIEDDDPAPVVTLVLAPATVSENGEESTVTATLDRASSEATTVTVSAAAVAPAVSGDFALSANRVLTVAAGATASTGTVTVTGVDNSLDAPDRTVTVSATASNSQGVTDPADVTLTLTDDDGASALSIDSPSVTEGDSGSATLTFAVTLAPASGQQVTVAWADAGTGTATPGTDYAAIAGGTLTFAPNETSKTIAVTVTGDRVDEPDETVVLTLSNPSHATLGTATGTGTITDDDPAPVVTLVLTPATVSENGGVSTVTATLDRASSEATTVTVSATAVSPAMTGDFTLSANTVLTIAAGATASTGTVTLTGVDNSLDAPDKTVSVSATATNGLGVTAPAAVTLTLTDDEGLSASIAATDPSPLTERTLDGARLTVVLDGATYASSLSPGQFTLTPAVSGLSVSRVSRTDADTAVLTLAFSGDLTADASFAVRVASGATTHSAALTTGPVTVTPAPDEDGPLVPRDVRVHLKYDTGIILRWTDPRDAKGIKLYLIEITLDGRNDWRQTTRSTSEPLKNGRRIGGFHDLAPNTRYDLRISACSDYDAEYCGDTVAVNDVRTATNVPSQPRNVAVTGGEQVGLGPSQARLTWEPPASDGGKAVAGYFVEFKQHDLDHSHSAYAPVASPGCDGHASPQCDVTNLQPHLEYDFRVAAAHADQQGRGNVRWEYAFLPRRPEAPANLAVSDVGAGRVTLSWDAAGGGTGDFPIQDYQYWYSDANGRWTHAGTTSGTTAVVRGLEPESTYWFHVRSSTVRSVRTIDGYRKQGRRSDWASTGNVETLGVSAHLFATDPAELTAANLHGAALLVDLEGASWELWVNGSRVGHHFKLEGSDGMRVWVDRVERVSASRLKVVLGNRGPWVMEDGELTLTAYHDTHTWNQDVVVTVPVRAQEQAGGLRVTDVTQTSITVAWDRVEGHDVWYQVRWQHTGSTGGWVHRWTRLTQHTLRGSRDYITPNTAYTVQVRSFDHGGAGFGKWSTAEMTTSGAQTSPTLSVDPPRVAEGDSGTTTPMTFTFTLSESSEETVEADFRIRGSTATLNDDYTVAQQSGLLTFAPGETSKTVTVTVTGDDAAEPDETIIVDVGWLENAFFASDLESVSNHWRAITGTIVDDDGDDDSGTSPNQRASVTVAAADPVAVAEGGSATYTVVLDAEPTADVTIAITSDNADVTVQPASLAFTPGNWQTAQTVTVSAARDDDSVDDAATLGHAASGADNYAGIAVASVNVAVTDDDTAGVTVSESSLSLEEGSEATYTVVLDTQPTTDVFIYPTAHGVTVQPSELIFTPENWRTPQTVTVTAAQDEDAADEQGIVDHPISVLAVNPGDEEYVSVLVPSVSVSVTDDEAATVEPQPPWTLKLVRNGQPFETVAETDADADYPSTFLMLERGSSTAPLPASLPVTVGGTAVNPEDYAFNHGNAFTTIDRKSADLMRGAGQITVKGDDLAEGAETIAFSVTIEGETLTATLTIADDDAQAATEASSDATLSGLAISGGRLSAAFAAATTAYAAIVPEAATSITVTPTVAHEGATVTVDGVAVESGSPSGSIAVSEGSTVTVRVTAEDGVTTQDYVLTVEPQPLWTLRLVRDGRPFTIVAETDADAEYPSTFLKLERGSSTAPIPEWLPVTVGGTAANPADYEFNQGNRFTTVNRKSDNLMRGARKITVRADGLDEEAETITFSVTIEGETLTATLTIAEPLLAVADASVEEAAGAALDFRVTLAPAVHGPVTVDWTTADGSAVAGADYTAGSGTLTFAAGETEKTVSVAVLDDDVDEGSETMTLRLSNPSSGVGLGDAEAVGTIGNADLMPQAWLARFGRTVADQVIDAVTARFEVQPQAGSEMRLAGQAIGAGGSPETWEAACGTWRTAFGDRDRHGIGTLEDGGRAGSGLGLSSGTGGLEDRCRSGTKTLTGRELLTGTSFSFTGGSAESGFGSVWGSGAVTRFDGREGELSVDGDVASAMLGADFRRERATVGLALAHSWGEGSYSGAGSGEVESTLTGVYPYGRYEVSKRLSLWGIAGYGAGSLTLKPEGGASVETDTDMRMGAVGARGVLAEAPADGGVELAVKTDGLLLRISSDSARDGDGGHLAGADADVSRLRLGLEGTWRSAETGEGGTLTPTFEVGVRHDGGDAETGFGVEAGGGLAWSDPKSGISADLKARGLLAHEEDGFDELGLSGSFGWDPAPGSDRGPSLTLTQTMGASASGGVDALFNAGQPAGLAANDTAAGLDARRFEAKLGYGLGAFGDRFTMTPELGFGLSNDSRTWGLGWRLNPSGAGSSSFELRLDATRREAANDDAEPEHGLQLRLNTRF